MKKGFTLVELLVVIGLASLILALSTTIIIPESKPKASSVFEQLYHRARMEALVRHTEVALGFNSDTSNEKRLRQTRIFVKTSQEQWEPITTSILPEPWQLSVESSTLGNGPDKSDLGFIADEQQILWISWLFSSEGQPLAPQSIIALEGNSETLRYEMTKEGALLRLP